MGTAQLLMFLLCKNEDLSLIYGADNTNQKLGLMAHVYNHSMTERQPNPQDSDQPAYGTLVPGM